VVGFQIRSLTRGRIAAALAGGALLAALPFARYASLGGAVAPHADHAARYGGQLGMVGDHHIELRRQRGQVEVFVSDAQRRPLQPRSVWVIFDGAAPLALNWDGHHHAGPAVGDSRVAEAVVILADGTRLALSFDLADAR
jgi:hypothetical protein